MKYCNNYTLHKNRRRYSHLLGYLICVIISFSTITQVHAETLIAVKIQKGSNLVHLARDYCMSRDDWKEIARINNLQPPFTVLENETILIPKSLLLTEELSAQVAYVSGSVIKHWSDGRQQPLAVGDRISTGQSIVTGLDGYAQLIFPDQKFTRVEPDTKLTISSLFKLVDGVTKAELFLEKGRLVHKVKKKLRLNDSFKTRTAVSITGIRGTEFRMKMTDAETNVVETLAGKVELKNNSNQQIVLKKGQGLRVAKGESIQPPKALPAPPEVPAMESLYKTLPFKIVAPAASSDTVEMVRLRIAKDKEGQYSILEYKLPPGAGQLITTLADGDYYAFYTAVDKEGLESKATDPVLFSVRTLPAAPVITSPETDGTSWDETIDTRWMQSDQAVKYFLELATDETFTSPIDSQYLTDHEYTTPSLEAGSYHFRVRSVAEDGFVSNYSQPIHFDKVDQPLMGEIDAASPDGIHLQWSEIIKDCTYDLEISKTSDFSSIFESKTGLSDNKLTMDSLPHGTYYVRIRAILEGGVQSQWTPTQKLIIEYESKWWEYVGVGFLALLIIII